MLKKKMILFLVLIMGLVAFSYALNGSVENSSNLNISAANMSLDNISSISHNVVNQSILTNNLSFIVPLNISSNQSFVSGDENISDSLGDTLDENISNADFVVESFYVEIGVENLDSDIVEGEVIVNSVELGSYVEWSQNITVNNLNNIVFNGSINLLDLNLAKEYYLDSLFILIYSDDELISDTFAFNVNIEPNSSAEFLIEYYTAPINPVVSCHIENLMDYIPSQALIIHSDLNLSDLNSDVCNVVLNYDTNLNYTGIQIPLVSLVNETVERIYSENLQKYIYFEDNLVVS